MFKNKLEERLSNIEKTQAKILAVLPFKAKLFSFAEQAIEYETVARASNVSLLEEKIEALLKSLKMKARYVYCSNHIVVSPKKKGK